MAANALVGLSACAVLLWLAYGPWQMVCADVARYEIFCLRDRLFDLAADDEISFDSEAYRECRLALNALIRHAHRLTIPRLLTFLLATPGRDQNVDFDLMELINSIPNENTRREVETIFRDALGVTFKMIQMKSPLIMVGHIIGKYGLRAFWGVAHRNVPRVRRTYDNVRNLSNNLVLSEVFCPDHI